MLNILISGQNAGLSFNAVPAVMQAPAPLAAKQWFTVITNGDFYGKPLAILSAIATGYIAYNRKYMPSLGLSCDRLLRMSRGTLLTALQTQCRSYYSLPDHYSIHRHFHFTYQRKDQGKNGTG